MNKLETREDGLYIGDKKVIKGFESFSGWYWFATELEQEDYGGHPLWYGFVQGFANEWGSIAAASVIAATPIAVLFLFFQKQITGGLTAGSIKG